MAHQRVNKTKGNRLRWLKKKPKKIEHLLKTTLIALSGMHPKMRGHLRNFSRENSDFYANFGRCYDYIKDKKRGKMTSQKVGLLDPKTKRTIRQF